LLLLISGCASNPNLTANQLTSNQTRLAPVARHSMPAALPKQASSVSANAGTDGSSLRAQQTAESLPDRNTSWLGRFIRDHVPYRAESATPSPAPRVLSDSSDKQRQVLDLVNRERANAGAPPLRVNARLTEMALTKAQEMDSRNYFSHNSPSYGSPFEMMKLFGISFRSAGENIAQGQSGPSEVMEQWMSNPSHRANILNSRFTEIGIAYYNQIWVQEFVG
jgi:Uncharacterized protein with SCP/PR1 domains